ncbi:MAG: efflux RND transporter permease subunit [Bacillota bacterium]
MRKLADFSGQHPVLIVFIVAVITLLAGVYAWQVEMTTDIKNFFPEDDPRVQTYEEVEEKFGGAENIMAALVADEIFTVEVLKSIESLSQKFQAVDGVNSIQSLTSVDDIKGSADGLSIEPLIQSIPSDPDELEQLKARVQNDDMYGGFLVSSDSQAALLVIEVDPEHDAVQVAEDVSAVASSYTGSGELYLTGTPILNNTLADSMQADLKMLVPLVLIMIGIILWLVFKSIRGVLLPFATVGISVIWTVGLMGYLGKDFSPLNAVMPIILISLGNAYGIYILKRYYEELDRGKGNMLAVKGSIVSVGTAVLMAGGTTVAGFSSNLLSDITMMQEFGLFTSFGIAVALLISLTFLPAVLTLLGKQKIKMKVKSSVIETFLGRSADFISAKPKIILTISLIIVIFALAGLPGLEIDSNFFNFFSEDSRPRIAYELVKDKFVGSESVEIIIEGDVTDPQVLHAISAFQDDLYDTGLVGRPVSLANIIARTNQALNDGDPAYDRIPDSPNLISQYLLLIEMNDNSYLERFLTFEQDEARIQAMVSETSGEGIDRLMGAIDDLTDQHFADFQVEQTSTGLIVLIDTLSQLIVEGQIKGLIFALITVFIIVYLLLRSLQGSSLAVILISLVTLLNFGVMGWVGIPLDIVTVLISSIGIGVGIDYSIHIYSRYLEEKNEGSSTEVALKKTMTTTGTAILSNAGAVISGFLILIFSSFPPFRYFGLLVSLIMLAAAAGSLFWIPAVITFTDKMRRQK